MKIMLGLVSVYWWFVGLFSREVTARDDRYWTATNPLSALRGRNDEVPQIGAEEWGDELLLTAEELVQTRDVEVHEGVLLERTGEFNTIAEIRANTIIDELGEWDPSYVDWDAPALIFREVAVSTMSDWGPAVFDQQRAVMVENIATRFMCGV